MKTKLLISLAVLLFVAWALLAENANITNSKSHPIPVIMMGTVTTFATLPTAPSVGQTATVTDGGAALAWGATVTGGGTAKYLVWWNGTVWTVVGK